MEGNDEVLGKGCVIDLTRKSEMSFRKTPRGKLSLSFGLFYEDVTRFSGCPEGQLGTGGSEVRVVRKEESVRVRSKVESLKHNRHRRRIF